MPNPEQTEQIPDNFDADSLREPTPKTLEQFNATRLQLEDLGIVEYEKETDPATSDFYTVKLIRQPFGNDTTISFSSFYGTDEAEAEWSQFGSKHTIGVKTAHGDVYEYSADTKGNMKLLIKRPGERVQREPSSIDPISTEVSSGVSMSLQATPEIAGVIQAAIAERREADALGLNIPTEASLKELNTVIKDALATGPVTPS